MAVSREQVQAALEEKQGGRVAAMKWLRSTGHSFATTTFIEIADSLTASPEEAPAPAIGGTLVAPDQRREHTTARTLVFTCAQSNTRLNEAFFGALLTYCKERDAELHISRFTYNKGTHGKKSIKPGTQQASDDDDLWFDPRITDYVSDVSLQVTPDLVFCGELNILPTRIDPLSSFKSYTRAASGIIPHVKMRMESVPTMKHEAARFLYTTGTVTARNYIQKAAGQVADFHHVFGALVVEIDDNGTWWARQLNADITGAFYDLDAKFTAEGVEHDNRVVSITHGDIHGNKVDPAMLSAASYAVDVLFPYNQLFHDIVDFQPRNHHNIKDPHFLHDMWRRRSESVEAEFKDIGISLGQHLARPGCRHYVITSNHDQAIEGWLRNPAGFSDPPNQQLWLELNMHCAVHRTDKGGPRPFAHLMMKHLPPQYNWSVVHEDQSLCIDGIQYGLHGHLGPNGARGSPKNLRTVGKANTGHTHSAGIVDGVYTAGVYGNLDMGYNKGLSSWSPSMIVTYANAKRAILTIKDGRPWR